MVGCTKFSLLIWFEFFNFYFAHGARTALLFVILYIIKKVTEQCQNLYFSHFAFGL
jgi:hypothetical protein